ncbi:uncharacterized protein LOC128869760 [Anastrepha ludens]|uniref:uncharacterized protein LOC128869760 n=1 Tax=Anastrepha ludens TaxID=28586 RepID=UPI0023B18761|nr:uncharacterized protein LOC128869760 [Anastrepha ludens]
MFTTCVIKDTALSNVQRMHYLKSSVQGEPEVMLRSFSVRDANFIIAWDLLQQRYDNTRRLVKSYLRNTVKLAAMPTESETSLRKLLDTVTESMRALQQLGRPTAQWDDWLIFLITEKLDSATVKEWEMSLGSPSELPAYNDLVSFLEKRILGLEAKNKSKDFSQKSPHNQAVRSHQTTFGRCPCCSGKHTLVYCPDFRKKTSSAKLDLVHKAKLCKNCLKPGHTLDECSSTYTCQRCMQKHHTLLHDSLSTQPNKVAGHHTRSDYLIQTPNTNDLTSVLLATAVIGIRSPTGHELQLRALLDNGSQASFISEFAVQQLYLRRTRLQVPITGISGCRVGDSNGVVHFSLHSLTEPEFNIDCSALVLPRLGHLMPLKRVDPKPYSEFLDLPLADPNFFEPGSIDVIIGTDLYGLLLRNDIKRSAINKVTAQNTHLGWVIYGRLPHTSTLLLATTFCATATTELNNLVQQLWKFNECEDGEGSSSMTQDEIYCEKLFERTVCRDLSGRYHVQYPFKESCDLAALSDSKSDALRLFAYQQARLQNNATLNEMYTAFMAEYRNLGHMEPVPSDDFAHPVCYIPHHGVYKKDSTTTKLRTVFNASRKYKGGVSLNDCLHVGPKLQSDLSSIILKWRMHRVAFIADIEKCYRQILVSRPDVDMQRIVWRDEQGKPAIYRLLTVTYGLNCSPYLTIKVLHTLATDEEHDFPAASKILTESFYMDDCLHGAATVEDALNIQRQLQQLLAHRGFNLRKWMSNSTEFMRHLYTEDENLGLSRNLNLDSETNALGIYWLCDTDSIGYKTNVTPIIGDITKRQQLSDVAKIYDPPGLLAPVVVKGKAICQQLWLSGVDWDDPIPDPLQQEWRRFRDEILQIRELKVPSWIRSNPGKHKQYISNRVIQIQELAPINAWKYVPTTTNPADIASRGIFPSQLTGLSLWWRGPPWLNRHSSTWPEQHNGSTDPAEELVLSIVTRPCNLHKQTDLPEKQATQIEPSFG